MPERSRASPARSPTGTWCSIQEPTATRSATRLVELPGIGPWTAAYVALRALGDPDSFMPTDLGVRRALERLGRAGDPAAAAALATDWRPWRSYALHHLWASLGG